MRDETGPREFGKYEGEEEIPLERGFGKGQAWDTAPADPVLALAVTSAGEESLAEMSENELLGAMAAAQRLMNQMSYYQTALLAEYAARNMEWDPKAAQETLGEFAHEEIAKELRLSGFAAKSRAERSYAARQRMPRCLELAHAGLIGDYELRIITEGTACVDPELTARADAMIAERAANLTPGQLRSLVAKVVHLVDPASAEQARKQARRNKRVEFGQELSGNAYLAAHELDVADAAAAKQSLAWWGRQMKRAGLEGSQGSLRADALVRLALDRDPITGAPRRLSDSGGSPAAQQPRAGMADGPWDGVRPADLDPRMDEDTDFYDPWEFGDEAESVLSPDGPVSGAAGGRPAALITIIVNQGTMDGTSTAAAEIAGLGIVGAAQARDLIAAASHNPATRWCITEVDDHGIACRHGCARGRHPWTPPGTGPPGPAAVRDFLRSLDIALEPVAQGTCDHRSQEPRHDPSRRLQHLIRARNLTCATPGCGAVICDIDHTVAWEAGGPTCECNNDPRCRHCHRVKQHPRWMVEQLTPATTRWTGPSGRWWTSGPTRYLL